MIGNLFSESTSLALNSIHSSKRGVNERTGVHAWHPYYAGYSEQFVVDVISLLAKSNAVILDPWNGSGTTTLVAQRLGYKSVGVEINPVMAIHSRAKDLKLLAKSLDIAEKTVQIVELATHSHYSNDLNTIQKRLASPKALRALLSLMQSINRVCETDDTPSFADSFLELGEIRQNQSTIHDFFLSAVFRVLRSVGHFKKGSNPTWLKLDSEGRDVSAREVYSLFQSTVMDMIRDLDKASRAATNIAGFTVVEGDSRSLPIQDDQIDLVITSPPYCTRIDYAISTKPELLLLGMTEVKVDQLRRLTIGAPVIVDKTIADQESWGTTCTSLLSAVANHQSKAAKSYYLPFLRQYFRDAYNSLQEIGRVLKKGGSAAVVVQSSYFKEIEIALGHIYVEMANEIGYEAEIARREIVRQHMAHINTTSSKYRKNKVYYEDVVLINK